MFQQPCAYSTLICLTLPCCLAHAGFLFVRTIPTCLLSTCRFGERCDFSIFSFFYVPARSTPWVYSLIFKCGNHKILSSFRVILHKTILSQEDCGLEGMGSWSQASFENTLYDHLGKYSNPKMCGLYRSFPLILSKMGSPNPCGQLPN